MQQPRFPQTVGQETLLRPPNPAGRVTEATTPTDRAVQGDQPALGETLAVGWVIISSLEQLGAL